MEESGKTARPVHFGLHLPQHTQQNLLTVLIILIELKK
jgi:hypothetical protein